MAIRSATQSGHGNTLNQIIGSNNRITVGSRELELTLIPWQAATRINPTRDLDLLDPAFRSVPLRGREADLTRLRARLQGDGIKITALIGRAGAGKTRLALNLLEELPQDWSAGFLQTEEAKRFANAHNLSRWTWHKPTLIVVDYAALLGSDLARWFAELAFHPPTEHQLRILLLERHAEVNRGWYRNFASDSHQGDRVRELFWPLEPQTLAPVDQANDRRQILAAGPVAAHPFCPDQPLRTLPAPAKTQTSTSASLTSNGPTEAVTKPRDGHSVGSDH